MPPEQKTGIGGYCPGHPWYYLLGGKPLSLKCIRENVRASDYRGYLADKIAAIDLKPEPARSDALRTLKLETLNSLRTDISRYREVVRALHRQRESGEDMAAIAYCSDVYVSLSLKHNHIYNDFGHLILLDDLLNRQGDLFGF